VLNAEISVQRIVVTAAAIPLWEWTPRLGALRASPLRRLAFSRLGEERAFVVVKMGFEPSERTPDTIFAQAA